MTSEEIRMLTKNELVAEYERTIKWYKEHNINRNFSKYAARLEKRWKTKV